MAPHSTPHETAGDPTPKADHAIDLLSDLEERLGALRTWQSQSEAQAEKVREQSQSLESRRRELDALQASLDDAQQELERNRQQLEEDRAQAGQVREDLEQQRVQLDDQQRDLDDRRAKLDERLSEIEQDAAQRRQQIDAEERKRLDAVAQRESEITESQAALDEARERIESREHRLDEAYAKLREEESYLLNQQEALQNKTAQVEAQAAGFDQRQAELDRLTQELAEQRKGLDAKSAQLDTKAQELRDLSAKVEAEVSDLETRQRGLDEVAAALQTEKEDLKRARSDLKHTQLDQQLKAEALIAQEEALARSRAALIAEASSAESPAGGVQPAPTPVSDETAAELEQVREEVRAAQAELTEVQSRFQQREQEIRELKATLEDRVAEVELLEEELGKSGDAAPQQDDLSNKIKAHEAEIADLRHQLEAETAAYEQAQARVEELEAQGDAAAPSTDGGPAIAELQAEIAERDRQLEEVHADLESRTAEADRLREQIDALKAGGSGDAGAAVEDADYARRRAELDEQAAQVAADRQRILERKAQLKQADEIIKKRRDKIRGYIAQIRIREARAATAGEGQVSAEMSASDKARLAGVEKERVALAEVKQFLEQSEAEMVQRWATQRTGSLVTSIVIALILAAGVSYFAGKELTQPLYRATMAMEVTPVETDGDLPPGAWLSSYKQTLLSEPVLSEALNQLDQRSIRIAGTPAELATHLRQTLSVEGDPNRVQLAYHGEDPSRTGAVLEAFGRGLMVFHMTDDRRAGRMNDSATVLQPAAVLPDPIEDEHLNYALAIFAGLVAFGALIALPLRLIFGRSRRVLDARNMPDLALLDSGAGSLSDDGGAGTHAVTNDGPPEGFARLPDQVDDEDDSKAGKKKTFRF